jgi:hypothetical protein
MNANRNATAGRRHTSDINFTTVRANDGAIEFDGVADAGERHRFSISAETLQSLGDTADGEPALMHVFESRKRMIFGVASRVFNAGVRGDPIQLHRGLFRSS